MKYYRTDFPSPKIAAGEAYKDPETCKKDQYLFKRIAKAKGTVRTSYFGWYIFFIVKKECFMFLFSEEGFCIKKLPFDPLNQLSDEQIVKELRKRGYGINTNVYLSCVNVVEKGVIMNTISVSDVQDILSKSTDSQLLNALYERKYTECEGRFFFLAR